MNRDRINHQLRKPQIHSLKDPENVKFADRPDTSSGPNYKLRPSNRLRRRLLAPLFVAFLVIVGVLGYAHLYWGGLTPFLCQLPQAASLLDREKITLKPFIVPSKSSNATYLLVTVELTVEKGKGYLISKQLSLLRRAVLDALMRGDRLSHRKVNFGEAIASVNAKLENVQVREMWIRRVRTI